MKLRIDINCDLGESYGHFQVGQDADIMPHITSANVACGFHAGDPSTMALTVELAKRFGVAVGAHPGLPDLRGFGRGEMRLKPEETRNDIMYQIGALQAFASASRLRLQHIKPHGALYNMATRDARLSETMLDAVRCVEPELIIFAPPRSTIAKVASKMGFRVAMEAFADRAYNADGTLVSRDKPKAVIKNPKLVVKRVVKMVKEGTVLAINGGNVDLGQVHTICVHSDTPNAPELAKALKSKLLVAKIDVKPVGSFL